MLLQVDVESLIKNRITSDYFLVTQMLYEKQYDLLTQYLDLYSREELDSLFLGLVRTGMVDNRNFPEQYDYNKLTVRPSFIKVLAQGDFFDELVQTFPASVVRTDGTKDYLRTDINRCRKLYSIITKNKYPIHSHILECLQYEVATRRMNGSLGYMKRIPKWLSSEEWKVYEQMMKDTDISQVNNKTNDLGYGNNLE
jgi:hypothetical protein